MTVARDNRLVSDAEDLAKDVVFSRLGVGNSDFIDVVLKLAGLEG